MDRNVQLLTFAVAVRMLGVALYSPFLALFLYNVLGLGYLEISALIVILGVIRIPFGVLGGLLSDRVGYRSLILLSLGMEAVATAGLAYSFALRSLPGAILAALVGGIITAAAGPAFSAYIADQTVGSACTQGFTWYRIGFNAGFSEGVAVGGLLIASLGFSGAVGTPAVVIGVASILLANRLPPSPTDRRRHPTSPTLPPPDAAPAVPRPSMAHSLRRLLADR
jgi:MFS family permease